ncbi:MAG: GNAT family N-acetyltransferase [Clostridia bacterium]|nr:GNAT family N-acetyltransferase [Clostridia bacterium]
MTYTDIRRIALEQSAIDAGCTPEDFTAGEIRTCISRHHPDARKYLKLPLFCDFSSYGSGIVVSACSEEIAALGKKYAEENPYPYTFETPSLHKLIEVFAPYHAKPYFMAEYFLPDPALVPDLPCPYPTKILTPPDFTDLYKPEWGNALVEKRKELDMLGVGAYDGDTLIALAACSADCDSMWQIGIDVLPDYRHLGLAKALTSRLTREILARDKVPFYCAAWSNIASVRNAIACGFRPAWVQLTCLREEN